MARSQTLKRYLAPDSRFGSVKVTRLIHRIMKGGKKALATRIVYEGFGLIEQKTGEAPLEILKKAAEHVTPTVEVRSRRIGGSNIPVPRPMDKPRQMQFFLRWLVDTAKKRREKDMATRLAYELIDAAKGEGGAVKKRTDMDKSARSHRAYSHLR